VVGLAGYLAFPTSVTSNILNSFSPTDPVMQATRAVVGVLEVASYPVNHFAARAAVADLLRQATGREVGGRAFDALEAAIFLGATLALALRVADLGAVFSLVGGTCGSVIILGMPGLLLLRYSRDKHRDSRRGGAQSRLLGGQGEGEERYDAWRSKLFAAGLALCVACAALFSYAVAAAAGWG
jgi:amino acid permease